jgi:hypothetical protein
LYLHICEKYILPSNFYPKQKKPKSSETDKCIEHLHLENLACHLAKPVFDDADISSGNCVNIA